MSLLNEILTLMLTESTGESFLDSGGAYGRHWEKNQGKDFEAQPMVEVESDGTFIVNLYPFLKENLRLDDICKSLNAELSRIKYHDPPTIREAIGFFHEMYPQFDLTEIDFNNTYNFDAPFSQDFQYFLFKNDSTGKFYVALSIHQGCDIRSGYTDIKFFETDVYIARVEVSGEYSGIVFNSEYDGITLRDGADNSIENFDDIDPENLENLWAYSMDLDEAF